MPLIDLVRYVSAEGFLNVQEKVSIGSCTGASASRLDAEAIVEQSNRQIEVQSVDVERDYAESV